MQEIPLKFVEESPLKIAIIFVYGLISMRKIQHTPIWKLKRQGRSYMSFREKFIENWGDDITKMTITQKIKSEKFEI